MAIAQDEVTDELDSEVPLGSFLKVLASEQRSRKVENFLERILVSFLQGSFQGQLELPPKDTRNALRMIKLNIMLTSLLGSLEKELVIPTNKW